MEIVKNWFNLMDENGWIPREQILGEEARSKVPADFQTQYDTYANPPTLFLAVQSIYEHASTTHHYSDQFHSFLTQIFPKMVKQYNWLTTSQSGVYPNSFRWRGRTENHTLTSGLDDYPRASSSQNELHLDLMCWMINSAKILSQLAQFLGQTEQATQFQQLTQTLLTKLDGKDSELFSIFCSLIS